MEFVRSGSSLGEDGSSALLILAAVLSALRVLGTGLGPVVLLLLAPFISGVAPPANPLAYVKGTEAVMPIILLISCGLDYYFLFKKRLYIRSTIASVVILILVVTTFPPILQLLISR